VQDITPVKDFAHARFDATERVYYYYISQRRDPFRDAFTWYVYGELDFDLMNRGAQILKEYSDFSCFSKAHTQVKTNNCVIKKAVWQKSGMGEWRFTIVADRFLRGMVRAIVGTLVLVGKNKITLTDLRRIIESKDRQLAGSNAPPNALFLTSIKYKPEIYLE
jgi:tRNA pseudouridine38-40 synthase